MASSSNPPLHRNHFGLRGASVNQEGGKNATGSARGQSVTREKDNSKLMMLAVLGVAGIGAAGYFVFGANGVKAGPQVYTDALSCAAAKQIPAQICQTEWKIALGNHAKLAPSYATQPACEAVHGPGKCIHPATPGDPLRAASFIPVMAAYVLARNSNGVFQGAPLHQFASDGPNKYRVSETPPKADDGIEPDSQKRGGGAGAFMFLRAGAANAATGPAAKAAAPASAMKPGGKPAAGNASRGGMGNAAAARGGGT